MRIETTTICSDIPTYIDTEQPPRRLVEMDRVQRALAYLRRYFSSAAEWRASAGTFRSRESKSVCRQFALFDQARGIVGHDRILTRRQ